MARGAFRLLFGGPGQVQHGAVGVKDEALHPVGQEQPLLLGKEGHHRAPGQQLALGLGQQGAAGGAAGGGRGLGQQGLKAGVGVAGQAEIGRASCRERV